MPREAPAGAEERRRAPAGRRQGPAGAESAGSEPARAHAATSAAPNGTLFIRINADPEKILKTLLMTKEKRAICTQKLRDKQILRDHPRGAVAYGTAESAVSIGTIN
jgi:hypothetical protein